MIESVDPAECGSYYMHSNHTYRTGFLWLNKKECSGSPWPESFVPPSAALIPKREHRHAFVLQLPKEQTFLNPEKTIWYCKCGQWVSVDRDLFHAVLLDA